jgi:hypothetical protein
VVDPFVKADDRALVKVITLLATTQPPGVEDTPPLVVVRVQVAWFVKVMDEGNVTTI